MATKSNSKTQQRSWNFVATASYAIFVVILGIVLKEKGIRIEDISLWDVMLLSLATYRLTRILVFDKIFKFFRDFIKSRSRLYAFHVIKEIITCPWCAGVWVALVAVILYYLVPFGNIFIYLMVISGIASFLVITLNYIGLSTEEKQHIVRELKEDSDYTKP
jgi:fatty acid desaturase